MFERSLGWRRAPSEKQKTPDSSFSDAGGDALMIIIWNRNYKRVSEYGQTPDKIVKFIGNSDILGVENLGFF